MSYNEQIAVEIYEKKFSLENLNWMYQEGRLHFPQSKELRKYPDTVAHLIEAIQIGIPMPVIYASELQNGDFLILESKERLHALLKFLQESFPVYVNETPPYSKNCFFHELNQKNPRLASMIFRTIFFFQVIDYHTPKYLHMETALFHEEWSASREQDIRNILYKGHGIEDLNAISKYIRKISNSSLPKKSFLKEYEILYMLLIWGIYRRLLPLDAQISYGEQELLEITISELPKSHYNLDDFFNIMHDIITIYICILIPAEKHKYISTSFYKNKKVKGKAWGLALCLFDMCQLKEKDPFSAFDRLLCSGAYMHDIKSLPITLNGIHSYLNFLWEEFIL